MSASGLTTKMVALFVAFFVTSVSAHAANCGALLAARYRPPVTENAFTDFKIEGLKTQGLPELLSQDENLAQLYESEAGVIEGYNILHHVRMVLSLFRKQYRKYVDYFEIQTPENVRLYETLMVTLALHDIGKPLAVEAGDRKLQHVYTLPILEQTMQKLGFNEDEIRLSKTLVDNHVMGDLVRRTTNLEDSLTAFKKLARSMKLPLCQAMPLQLLFYSVDAGSYPEARLKFVIHENQVLIPKNSGFLSLYRNNCKLAPRHSSKPIP